MKAFHNSKAIKKKYLNRVTMHEKADEIVKGHYWENGKGCAVGCTIHGSAHAQYEKELGIPGVLAKLEDRIFEGLPNELAKTWPRRFLQSIKPGADLSSVFPKFMLWLLIDETNGVINFANSDQIEAIQTVADLFVLEIEGAKVHVDDWNLARTAASAYTSAATNAAQHAANAAAYAADAADAADAAAAYAAAAYAARENARIAQSEKLLELLKECK